MLGRTAKPFVETLSRWLHVGSFTDLHGEFLVTDLYRNRPASQEEAHFGEDYLNARFTLNGKNTPRMLEDVQQKVLLIGLYRNIENHLNSSTAMKVAVPFVAPKTSGTASLQWDRKG